MTSPTLIPTDYRAALPSNFDWVHYIDTERELWMLFPEVEGKRTNFSQIGLCVSLFEEVPDNGPLNQGETYFLMPDNDKGKSFLRMIRMRMVRMVTPEEYRMSLYTSAKMIGMVDGVGEIYSSLGDIIIGDELKEEVRSRAAGA